MFVSRGYFFTFSVSVTLRRRAPLLPYTVNVWLPVGVAELVLTVRVEEPDVVTDSGLKPAVVLDGTPFTLKPTTPVNPPEGVTVIV